MKFKNMRSVKLRTLLISILFLVSIATIPFLYTKPAQAAACSSTEVQNGIQVVPSHGQAFYIDTGTTPKLDAGYIGYQVVNKSGTTKSNLWVEVSNFTGNVISLANIDDSPFQLASIVDKATSTAYFLIKATGATNNAQTHTVKVYSGRPDVSGNFPLYTCTYSFSAVRETITAGSNTIDSISASNTSPSLGQTVVVTVNGTTGTIGSGKAPDNDMVWLAPSGVSSWPTRALRLENVSVAFTRSATTKTYTNRLFFNGVDLAGNGTQSNTYVATYTFRVIGRPLGTVKVLPASQISSGTQVKHANVSGAVDISFPSFSVNASVTKTVTATTSLQTTTINGVGYVGVPYRIQITSSATTTLSIDEIVDVPASGTIFKTGSASTTDLTRSGVSIPDPIYISSESAEVPRPNHFIGPFTFNSSKAATLDYVMWVPAGSADNVAYSKTGDLVIGQTPSSISKVVVTSDGTATVGATTTTQAIDPTAITQPATNITSTGGTLNGTIDPHSNTPLTATFEYSVNSDMSSSVTVTATTPTNGDLSGGTLPTNVSVALTGLSTNTTYYYRVKAGSVFGDIISFSTLAVQATPTVTAQAANNITLTSATINGTINPNLTSVTAIRFIYGTSPTLSSGNSTTTLQDSGSTNGALQAGGSSAQAFSTDITSLTGGTTYYYKIQACTSSTGTYPTITCSVTVDSSIVSFIASAGPTASTTNATSIGASIATLNGVIKANYADTSSLFTYGTSSTLSSGNQTISAATVTGSASTTVSANIIGLTPATVYYFKVSGSNILGSATGTILSFTTASVNRTIAIDPGSYTSTYAFNAAAPTITATPSSGGGAKTFSSFTTNVCTIDSSSGAVTFISAGTCTIGAAIAASDTWSDASSPSISFTITAVSRTLSINSSSFSSSYVYNASHPTAVATPSSGGGIITYESLTESICTVDSFTGGITFVDIGTCTVRSSIGAVNGYSAATSSSVTFLISALSRTLSFDSNSYSSTYNLTDSAPTVSVNVSNGIGTITYSSETSDVCTIDSSSGAVTFISAGTCTLGASIDPNGVYESANANSISFSVSKANRSLIIDSGSYVTSYVSTDAEPTVSASATVGLGVIRYSSFTTSVCTINSASGKVSFVGTGTCTIGASITAHSPYDSADAPNISFVINAVSNTQNPTTNPSDTHPTHSTGSSVQSQVRSLLSMGNTRGAQDIMRKWPNLFSNQTPASPVATPEACPPYLKSYIKTGENNDAVEVKKLQTFLNEYEGEALAVDGVYKQADVQAVNRFQSKHQDILVFWNLKAPTGYVYVATQKAINKIYCEKTKKVSCPYFTEYVDPGSVGAEVVKIKMFLNETQGTALDTSSAVYDQALVSAVKSFQAKFTSKILTPWGFTNPTGRWYQSTRKAANDILGCFAPVKLDNGKVIE